MTAAALHPVIERIAAALRDGDRAALAALYAPDAEYLAWSGSHPPAAPLRLTGPDVAAYVAGIPAEIRMTLDEGFAVEGRAAFLSSCRLPGGGRAVTAHMLDLDAAGRIARHLSVESADA